MFANGLAQSGGEPYVGPPQRLKRLPQDEMQIYWWRPILPADDDEGGAFGWADRHRRRVVEEVLVSTQPSLGISRQRFHRLVLRAQGAGDGDVARRKRNSNRNANSYVRVEQAQKDADREHQE